LNNTAQVGTSGVFLWITLVNSITPCSRLKLTDVSEGQIASIFRDEE
jgi:hypothetical protein